MKVLKLRNHIPIGGPARREPADGTETGMRVSLGFEPKWFCLRCNTDFSEKWHKNPIYRYRSLEKMKHELVKAFPSVAYWDEKNTEDLATISGIYGAYVVPQIFGIPLRYNSEAWPELEPGRKLTITEIDKLDINRLLNGPFTEELFSEMEVIQSEWGKIHGYLNWQGVLNNAFHLRGQEIFLDIFDKPDFAHNFFSLISDVMIKMAKAVQKKQRDSGFYIDQFSVSNCFVNMISPQAYREFIFPCDTKIAHQFERFGCHICNWDITPYIDSLKELPKLGYIDMGMMSDLPRVRKTFSTARRAVMYSPVKLKDADLQEIRTDMEKIYRELSPCDIVLADVQFDTPDKRVNDLLEICGNPEAL